MTEKQLREYLQSMVKAVGNQRALAIGFGVSERIFSEVLKGNRRPTHKILEKMHLREVVSYEFSEKDKAMRSAAMALSSKEPGNLSEAPVVQSGGD